MRVERGWSHSEEAQEAGRDMVWQEGRLGKAAEEEVTQLEESEIDCSKGKTGFQKCTSVFIQVSYFKPGRRKTIGMGWDFRLFLKGSVE